jgi:hypothetical protein
MVITNSNENKINWNVKVENKGGKFIKAIGNLVFIRGDKIYEERSSFEDEYFGVAKLYSTKFSTGLTSYRDSHRLFGHEKSIGVLSNNQS